MGQAKIRGNQEQRIADAKARERAKFPEAVACNNCHAQLTEIEPMDVRGIDGMRLAGAAFCNACDSSTWVLDGTPEGLKAVSSYLADGHDDVTYGQVLRPKS